VLSGASPEAFGAAVGRGLEQAGETADRSIHQRARSIAIVRRPPPASPWRRSRPISTIGRDDARNNAEPGGAGHSEAIVKRSTIGRAQRGEDQGSAYPGGLRRALRRASGSRRHARICVGSDGSSRRASSLPTSTMQGTQYANAQASPNVSSLAVQSIGDVATTVGALAVPADAKAKAIKEQQRKIAVAFGERDAGQGSA
jgi:hypothetical protein